jgi:hypothetical protein
LLFERRVAGVDQALGTSQALSQSRDLGVALQLMLDHARDQPGGCGGWGVGYSFQK